jgi:hypothetical protein
MSLLVGIVLLGAGLEAPGQMVDCPLRNAPVPQKPPGPPPDWIPDVDFPKVWDGKSEIKLKVKPPPLSPPSQELLETEDGYVSNILHRAERARTASSPPPAVLGGMADVRDTVLARWQFVGYGWDHSPNRVSRIFTRDGSTLEFEQWNYALDGGAIFPTRSPDSMVGRLPATSGGLRGPSGCVAASLNWQSETTLYELHIAGPLSLEAQRATLMEVATSIDAALANR